MLDEASIIRLMRRPGIRRLLARQRRLRIGERQREEGESGERQSSAPCRRSVMRRGRAHSSSDGSAEAARARADGASAAAAAARPATSPISTTAASRARVACDEDAGARGRAPRASSQQRRELIERARSARPRPWSPAVAADRAQRPHRFAPSRCARDATRAGGAHGRRRGRRRVARRRASRCGRSAPSSAAASALSQVVAARRSALRPTSHGGRGARDAHAAAEAEAGGRSDQLAVGRRVVDRRAASTGCPAA